MAINIAWSNTLIVLLVCVVYAGLFVFTVYAVARYYGVEKAPGWRASTNGRSWFVVNVDETGPAAGRIQPGDRLLAINGDEHYAWSGLFEWSRQQRDIHPVPSDLSGDGK